MWKEAWNLLVHNLMISRLFLLKHGQKEPETYLTLEKDVSWEKNLPQGLKDSLNRVPKNYLKQIMWIGAYYI